MKKIIICQSCQAINKTDLELAKSKAPICGKCKTQLDITPKVSTVDQEKLNKIIRHAELPVFIDIFADWCGPCKMYGPIFSDFGNENWSKGEFYKLDSEKNSQFCINHSIRGIPATIIYYQSKLIKNQSGLLQKNILSSLLAEVSSLN